MTIARNAQSRYKKPLTFEEINPGYDISEKERLKKSQAEYNQVRAAYRSVLERYNQLTKAKKDTLIRLDNHFKELSSTPVEKVPAWASVKLQLQETISALDILLSPAYEKLERAERSYKQSRTHFIQAGGKPED